MNWNDSEFDELASELRQQVGGEFRMEAEAVEEDAAKLVLRKRDLADVVLEFLISQSSTLPTHSSTSISEARSHCTWRNVLSRAAEAALMAPNRTDLGCSNWKCPENLSRSFLPVHVQSKARSQWSGPTMSC